MDPTEVRLAAKIGTRLMLRGVKDEHKPRGARVPRTYLSSAYMKAVSATLAKPFPKTQWRWQPLGVRHG